MEIRHARLDDLPRMLEIYEHARAFMAQTGNPRQWGPTHWPPEPLLREDIAVGRSYVCTDGDRVVGTFCYIFGDDIDPTYRRIEEGAWCSSQPYGVVHRIAAQGAKGVGRFCLGWALQQSGYLRVDTHPDNRVMRNLLTGMGFTQCGIIHVVEDNDPRYAFEKLL